MEYKVGINSRTLAINHRNLEPRSSRFVSGQKAFDSADEVPAPSPELERVAAFATGLAASFAGLKWSPLYRWTRFDYDSLGHVYPGQRPPTIYLAAYSGATPESLCRTICHEVRHLAQKAIDEQDAAAFAERWGAVVCLAGRKASWKPHRVKLIGTSNPNGCTVDSHHDVIIGRQRRVVWTQAKWAGPRWVGVHPPEER